MDDNDEQLAPLSLAAARALFRAPQPDNTCWADVHMPDGTVRACGRPEATSLGLCPDHRVELFGLGPPAPPDALRAVAPLVGGRPRAAAAEPDPA
jgi:hypothetical protein